jgi:hypothetical protein
VVLGISGSGAHTAGSVNVMCRRPGRTHGAVTALVERPLRRVCALVGPSARQEILDGRRQEIGNGDVQAVCVLIDQLMLVKADPFRDILGAGAVFTMSPVSARPLVRRGGFVRHCGSILTYGSGKTYGAPPAITRFVLHDISNTKCVTRFV